ncbi:MAG: hypothetical protein WCG05_05410 [Alphaproteobacteria bacterium]
MKKIYLLIICGILGFGFESDSSVGNRFGSSIRSNATQTYCLRFGGAQKACSSYDGFQKYKEAGCLEYRTDSPCLQSFCYACTKEEDSRKFGACSTYCSATGLDGVTKQKLIAKGIGITGTPVDKMNELIANEGPKLGTVAADQRAQVSKNIKKISDLLSTLRRLLAQKNAYVDTMGQIKKVIKQKTGVLGKNLADANSIQKEIDTLIQEINGPDYEQVTKRLNGSVVHVGDYAKAMDLQKPRFERNFPQMCVFEKVSASSWTSTTRTRSFVGAQ